ncbi:5'-methylthioadenosine phosphorylase [Actibacterium sp. 188UL27-1]|uniref:5'-methylthioadenosine phosphorylase n=1 Tax=Actibacterium sp. 188UL27-1 TaxID=2786961 RepID=UPI00195B7523|nr:5'-methylthioadenosine phosphorylase [Actibacterium sp. 188UL27-1]MBM7069453.1 5'-methylthioadenosine phosphorylase [Actibacterium sp. 188UL27-1]
MTGRLMGLGMALLLTGTAAPAQDADPPQVDGYVMGAGRWTCERARTTFETGTEVDQGQLFGWLMGYWSAATQGGTSEFITTVQEAGGKRIAEITLTECAKQHPETSIIAVTEALIDNTRETP